MAYTNFPDQKTYTRKELSQRWEGDLSKIDAYIRTGQLKAALPPVAIKSLRKWVFYRCHNNEKFNEDEINVGLLDIIEDGETFEKYAGKIGQGKITSFPGYLYVPIDDNAIIEEPEKDYILVRYFYDLEGNALIMVEDAESEYEICFAPIKKEHLDSLIIPLEEVKRFERENNITQKSKQTPFVVERQEEITKQNREDSDALAFKPPPNTDPYLTKKAAARLIGFSTSYVDKMVKAGKFPPPIKIRDNVRWRTSVVVSWMEEREKADKQKTNE